ncbi:MAG: hypothetical protein LC105_05425 [Chitinophagales bacterium]|nr:hypothetical protein [Chitinophagales bacterium]MCZ2393275.1 hypothetical protein [Chitinophagales bacterium]
MSVLNKISFVDSLRGDNPATVNRRTGEMYVSAKIWKQMTPDQRLFMMLHEEGHVILQTTNEFEADRYAFEQYIRTGRSLKHLVSALTHFLDSTNPEHIQRAQSLLAMAIKHDRLNKKKK